MLAPLALVIIPVMPGGIAAAWGLATGAGRATSAAANSEPPTMPATSAPVTVATLLISASSSRRPASRPTRAPRSCCFGPRSQRRRGAQLQDRAGRVRRPTPRGVVFALPVGVGPTEEPHPPAPSPSRWRGGRGVGLL